MSNPIQQAGPSPVGTPGSTVPPARKSVSLEELAAALRAVKQSSPIVNSDGDTIGFADPSAAAIFAALPAESASAAESASSEKPTPALREADFPQVNHPWAGSEDGHDCQTCIEQEADAEMANLYKCDRMAHVIADVAQAADEHHKRVATENLHRHGSIAGPGLLPPPGAAIAASPAAESDSFRDAEVERIFNIPEHMRKPTPAPPALDVERLARAAESVAMGDFWENREDPAEGFTISTFNFERWAAAIAAEYARLASPADAAGDGGGAT